MSTGQAVLTEIDLEEGSARSSPTRYRSTIGMSEFMVRLHE